MMTSNAFLGNLALALVVMALLAVVETVLPFVRKRDWRRRHLIPNLELVALTLGMNFVFNAGAVLVTAWLAARGFGLLAGTSLPAVAMVPIGIIALDASTYVCHRLMHVLPPLWRAHRVHHSDPLVDVTTALRFHPIETSWRFLFIVVPAWALGLPVGAVAIYRVVSVWVALLEHMNVEVWQPLDRALSLVVGTPNMHKVHHSRQPVEANTNFGNIFSVFDRALGTFTPSSRARAVEYGLMGYDAAETQEFRALLRLPFRRRNGWLARQSKDVSFQP